MLPTRRRGLCAILSITTALALAGCQTHPPRAPEPPPPRAAHATHQPLLCPCEFLIPLAYNKGAPVPHALIDGYLQELDRRFGGWTDLGTRTGSWHGQVEQSKAVVVAVRPDQVDALREVVKSIGKELGQIEMYFECRPPSVELIRPDEPGN